MATTAIAKPKAENNKKLVVAGLMIGLIFSELDETVVSTAMPTIIRELHGLALYGWVAGIYMLAATLFMPIIGKMADLYGRKKVYLTSMGLFITGSIVCGLSTSMEMLLAGRALQGIGAGGLMPLALVIIGDTFPLEQRAKVQSLFGPLMILPQLLGPTVGGYMVGHVNWHWVFLINIPIGLLAAAIMSKGMRESKGDASRKIDWAGAFTLMIALLSLLMAPVLIENKGYSWSSPIIIGMLVLSALFTALFVWIESKVKEPIIPLHLFRNRTVVTLSILVFLMMLGIMGGLATFPFFAQNVMGLTPTASGYLMLGFMAGAIPTSIVAGFLITKVPYKYLFVVGLGMPVIGYALLTQISVSTTVLYILVSFFVLGLGIGVFMGGDNVVVQESVPKEHSGVALATVQLFQSIGATIGMSIFGSILARNITSGISGIRDQLPEGVADTIVTGGIPADTDPVVADQVRLVFADAFQNLFVLSIGFVIVSFLVTWFLKREVLKPRKEEEEQAEQPIAAVAVNS